MRWIKASEKEPSPNTEYHVRCWDEKFVLWWDHHEKEFYQVERDCKMIYFSKEQNPDIEWLDESIQDVPDTNVGEIDRYYNLALFIRGKVIEGATTNGEIIMHVQHFLNQESSHTAQPTEIPTSREVPPEELDFRREICNLLKHFLWNIKPGDPAAEQKAYDQIAKEVAFRAWSIINAVYEGAGQWAAKCDDLQQELSICKDTNTNLEKNISTLTNKALEISVERDEYYKIADQITRIFYYGNWKVETAAERYLEEKLIKTGLWPTTEDEIIKRPPLV